METDFDFYEISELLSFKKPLKPLLHPKTSYAYTFPGIFDHLEQKSDFSNRIVSIHGTVLCLIDFYFDINFCNILHHFNHFKDEMFL